MTHIRTAHVQRCAVSAIACNLRDGRLTAYEAAVQMRRWSVPLGVALRIVREHA